MRRLIIAFATLLPSISMAAAPFCAVTSSGAQCFYYDLGACRQAISGIGGQCVANPAALPPIPVQNSGSQIAPLAPSAQPQLIHYDMAEAARKGAAAGMARRHAEEEHQARMSLLQAQTNAASAPAASDKQPSGYYTVNYDCTAGDGSRYKSKLPIPGCVVISIDFD
ncbi:hypothetical protein [Lysobacter capsici]|nr:hypothetical protein [Lysobacter capsici]WND79419.1 hypothetical protein RJ610_19260 [Lysobacter capsici]WND84615.1 hypothetical protein RJ609_19275 [Lysobacter capsici]